MEVNSALKNCSVYCRARIWSSSLEEEMRLIAQLIDKVLKNPKDVNNLKKVKSEVQDMCKNYPLYPEI